MNSVENEMQAVPIPVGYIKYVVFVVRFNKLGLDKITASDEPASSDQVEEIHSFTAVQSAPLNVEKIAYIDIGTAHSVAVTGTFIFLISRFVPVCQATVHRDSNHGFSF